MVPPLGEGGNDSATAAESDDESMTVRKHRELTERVFCFSPSLSSAPLEPLLCKFADGGQKKRQSQNKFAQNGRGWLRDGDSRLVSDPPPPNRSRIQSPLLLCLPVENRIMTTMTSTR